jgi:hypothetical protein
VELFAELRIDDIFHTLIVAGIGVFILGAIV